jgi:hypothetical protein
MIVNPGPGGPSNTTGERTMRFSYYGQPYGYAPTLGYYADPVEAYYGAAPGYGAYAAEPAYGYYGEAEPVGYYADETPLGYYADPYAGQHPNMGAYYGPPPGYAQAPEMAGYGDPYGDPYGDAYAGDQYADAETYGDGEDFADEYPGVADYADNDMSGYVRETPPPFNAGCPMPTNVGMGDADAFAGYVAPSGVNATCQEFTAQPGSPASVPDTFRPLW